MPRPLRCRSPGAQDVYKRQIIVYGIANGIPDFLDIREKTKELHDEGLTGLIPFLSIIGNGYEIFCFDKDNNIVLLDCYTTGEAAPVEGCLLYTSRCV